MAPPGPRYFAHRNADGHWPSLVVSLGVTVALFALAFGAMTSLRTLSRPERSSTPDGPVTITFPTIAPTTPAVAPPPRATTKRSDEPSGGPITTAPRIPVAPAAPPVVAPSAAPIPSSAPPRDTAAAGAPTKTSIDLLHPLASPGAASGKRIPGAPSWVTSAERVPFTPLVRDSIAREIVNGVPDVARTRAPTGRERLELEATQRLAAMLRQRSTTSGNSRDLVILQGKGKDGVGAVGGPGIVSIPFPLFSSGPSPEQRKKNEKIDADNQLRLRRLQDRMYLKQDSIRADSVRADSLRRDSVAMRLRARP
jgi:hypothetical protein